MFDAHHEILSTRTTSWPAVSDARGASGRIGMKDAETRIVVRDFAQREIKHWIFAAMVAGLALSTLTAWPVIVVASGVAFLVSETVDWAVYTFSNRQLSQRILISSCISAPVDQVLFIGLASFVVPGIFAWGTILTGVASKLVGAYIVSRVVAAQERRTLQNDMNPA